MNLFSAAVGLALVSYAGSGVFAPPASHLSGPQSHVQLAYDVEKYWVFCINEKTSVEMWDLEQMHVRYGSDVCQLYETPRCRARRTGWRRISLREHVLASKVRL